MATATPPAAPPPSAPPKPKVPEQLRISLYERVASTLVSLLILVGTVVLFLFLMVLFSRMIREQETVPVEYIEAPYGRGDHAAGFARDPEPPGAEELEQLEEPALEQSVEAVTDVVSSVSANLMAVEGMTAATQSGTGQGDSRPPGPLGDGEDIIPRSERWQIQYPSGNLRAYGGILDYFKIELGVIGGGRKEVEYASNFSRNPTKRTGPPDEEKRLYMTWRSGEMKQADASLLAKAGVKVDGGLQMQFIPPDTENLMAAAEHEAMGDRKLKEVQKTVFGVRPQRGGFEFYVIDHRYRVVN